VRYDSKDGWENYHPDNSEIPTSYISAMTFDKSGILYLATRQGLVKIDQVLSDYHNGKMGRIDF
jgi:ligand-binding sensor domain-containing protein